MWSNTVCVSSSSAKMKECVEVEGSVCVCVSLEVLSLFPASLSVCCPGNHLTLLSDDKKRALRSPWGGAQSTVQAPSDAIQKVLVIRSIASVLRVEFIPPWCSQNRDGKCAEAEDEGRVWPWLGDERGRSLLTVGQRQGLYLELQQGAGAVNREEGWGGSNLGAEV